MEGTVTSDLVKEVWLIHMWYMLCLVSPFGSCPRVEGPIGESGKQVLLVSGAGIKNAVQ